MVGYTYITSVNGGLIKVHIAQYSSSYNITYYIIIILYYYYIILLLYYTIIILYYYYIIFFYFNIVNCLKISHGLN